MPVDEQLAERGILEYLPENSERLGEDLLAVCDEQQPRVPTRGARPPALIGQPPIIECRNEGLARARRSDNKIAVPVVDLTLPTQVIKHLLLKGVRVQVEQQKFLDRPGRVHGVHLQGNAQPLDIVWPGNGVVRLESMSRVLPVDIEGRAKLAYEVRRLPTRKPHVPLHPLAHRLNRHI